MCQWRASELGAGKQEGKLGIPVTTTPCRHPRSWGKTLSWRGGKKKGPKVIGGVMIETKLCTSCGEQPGVVYPPAYIDRTAEAMWCLSCVRTVEPETADLMEEAVSKIRRYREAQRNEQQVQREARLRKAEEW